MTRPHGEHDDDRDAATDQRSGDMAEADTANGESDPELGGDQQSSAGTPDVDGAAGGSSRPPTDRPD